jgi:hypothetical protein
VALLPFVGTTFNYISRVLSEHNIKVVGLLLRKLPSNLQPIKDDLALKMPGVNSIPCDCEKVCIGQSGHSIETVVKNYHQHIHLYHPKMSVVAEHSINLGHWVQLQNTSILAKKSRWMDWNVTEVVRD